MHAPVGEYVLFAAWIHRLSTESQRKQTQWEGSGTCSRGDWPLDLRDPFQPRTKEMESRLLYSNVSVQDKMSLGGLALMQGPCCSLKSSGSLLPVSDRQILEGGKAREEKKKICNFDA